MAGTYPYRIGQRDIDASLRARLCSMGDLVLQAAGDDADTLGFGVSDLNLDNASWVLSRMAVEMRRLPALHQQIAVYTWVSDYGRLFTTRNMTIADGNGIEIGAAVTQWAMIDLDTRRPLDLSPLSSRTTSLVDRKPPIDKPRKIPSVALTREQEELINDRTNFERKGAEPHFSRKTVVYSDIDFNGHVYSMKYLEWMVDILMADPDGGTIPGNGCRFDINYLHEARPGDALTILSAETAAETPADSSPDKEAVRRGRLFDIRNPDGVSICKASIAPLI
jgi:acyl-ACP thioesterase